MSDKNLENILNSKMPGLTEKACKALDELLDTNDVDNIKVAINGVSKLLPYVVARKQSVELKVEGTITSDAEEAIKGWLDERRKKPK